MAGWATLNRHLIKGVVMLSNEQILQGDRDLCEMLSEGQIAQLDLDAMGLFLQLHAWGLASDLAATMPQLDELQIAKLRQAAFVLRGVVEVAPS